MGLWRMIRRMDTKRMWETVGQVAREARRPRLVVLCDMAWCGFRYQAGYWDYSLFRMWELSGAQRATVLTRGRNNQYVRALNKKEDLHWFSQKAEFLQKFAPYVKRRWLDLTKAGPEELEALCKDLGVILVKPQNASHGSGIEKIYADSVKDWKALYDKLTASGQTLCEEVIPQHPDLDRLWPHSINTVRAMTILKDGETYVWGVLFRVGKTEGKPVDNFNNGGLMMPVDVETGVIHCPGVDLQGKLYETHPVTGVPFNGFQIPCWKEIMDLVKEAAKVVPTVGYVGWDVAVTPTGPVLVEGNEYPGHRYAMPGQSPDGMGVLPRLDAIIPYKSL